MLEYSGEVGQVSDLRNTVLRYGKTIQADRTEITTSQGLFSPLLYKMCIKP